MVMGCAMWTAHLKPRAVRPGMALPQFVCSLMYSQEWIGFLSEVEAGAPMVALVAKEIGGRVWGVGNVVRLVYVKYRITYTLLISQK